MQFTVKVENKEIYDSLVRFLKSLNIQVVSEDKTEDDSDWKKYSYNNISRAYAEDEPDYKESMIKEPNPNYERS